jgi:predicted nucleic acid-binding Zn ribbon protein
MIGTAGTGDILSSAMPTYVYKFVDTGETIEIQQSFHDDTLTEAVHPDTGKAMAVKKVFQPVGVTFKGDGFYKTDSRSKKSTTSSSEKKAGSTADSGESAGSKPAKDSSGSSGSSSTTTSGSSD